MPRFQLTLYRQPQKTEKPNGTGVYSTFVVSFAEVEAENALDALRDRAAKGFLGPDVWIDKLAGTAHSQRTAGGTHGALATPLAD